MKIGTVLNGLLLISIIILVSCTGNKKNTSDSSLNQKVDSLFSETNKVSSDEVNYRIPTPIDLFVLLQSQALPFVGESLNKVEKSVQYNTTGSRAINFGIYSTDLAYCSVYGNFQSSLLYYNSAKEMAMHLGIYEGYGEEIANRINKNISNVDSLIDISSETYYQVTSFLEDQGMADLLALIRVGCWIESLYIAVESVDSFDETSLVIERIADQQLLLDNLLSILEQNAYSESVNEVYDKLLELQEVYDQLYDNSDDVQITKEEYVDIVNKVRELRKGFVG